jgi:L-ascorbate metabolism protein UlaG (beta-lactamase superfamily)
LGPKRVRRPGLEIDELPPIHIILISHNHYDHMDLPALKKLAKKHRSLVVVPLGNSAIVVRQGFSNVVELDWWESHKVDNKTEIHLIPAKHWSGRGLADRDRALWAGFYVNHQNQSILFAGDSGYDTHFKEVAKRLGPAQVAILPIGAYEPRWFMREQHMNPSEAVQAHIDLKARFSIGMHFGCFKLTNEGIDDPVQALAAARLHFGISDSAFQAPETGETISFSAL